jgi:DNA-binding transcriptional MerR regulator
MKMGTLAMVEQLKTGDFKLKSNDIKNITGLTYRKLNDWEKKGIIPSDRNVKEGWRYFTPSEAFAIAICAELRERMDLSFEKLKWICMRLLAKQAGDSVLIHSLRQIARYGGNVCIFTDSRKMLAVEHEIIVEQWIAAGRLVEAEAVDDFIYMKIKSIIERLIHCVFNQKIAIEPDPKLYQNYLKTKSIAVDGLNSLKPEEKELISLIRSNTYPRISLRVKDGCLSRIKLVVERNVELEKLGIIIKNEDLQNLQLEKQANGIFKLAGEKVITYNQKSGK